MQYKTMLEASVPRVKCTEHGVLTEQVPWSEPGGRLTRAFELLAIAWLQEAPIQAVARLLRLDWSTVDKIMHRAVERGMARRKPEAMSELCVDETAFQKRHEYVTVVSNRDNGAVLYVADGRSEEALSEFFGGLSKEQLDKIDTVTMDMWTPYINATSKHVPRGDESICFDRYHVASSITKAVNSVRRAEHREQLKADGASVLTGTRHTWMKNHENLSRAQKSVFAKVRTAAAKTASAWYIKELARNLWSYVSFTWAEKGWHAWIDEARATGLAPIIKVADMVERNLWGILNAVVTGTSNAMAESINSKIKMLKVRSRGFRSRVRFRTLIMFHCGKLDMSPFATH